jgi:hypothetical protein
MNVEIGTEAEQLPEKDFRCKMQCVAYGLQIRIATTWNAKLINNNLIHV